MGKLTENQTVIFRAWLIWLLAALFYLYEFFIRVSPNVMVPQIMEDFHVQAAELSIMASTFYWAYAITQIPAGILVDRFGAKRLLISGVMLVAVGNFIFANVDTVLLGSMGRFLIGIGSAFAFVCTLKLITEWFPPTRFAVLAGLTNFLGYTGAALAGEPLSYVLDYVSWREVMTITAIIGLILAVGIWFIVKDRPIKRHKRGLAAKTTMASVIKGLRDVLKNPQSWYNAIYTGLVVAPTSTFAALWGVPYLVHVDHLSTGLAAGASSMIFVGIFIGSPIWGWISDRIRLRRTPLIIATVGSIIVTIAILYINTLPILVLYSLCFLFGFFQSAHVLNFAIAHEINRPAANGAAIGFTNMVLILGGAIFQPVVGFILGWQWTGETINNIPVYTIPAYHYALIALPLCQLLALVIVIFFIKETHCKPHYSYTPKMRVG